MNSQDGIVDEVRTAREAYARRFDFDLRKMYEDLKVKERTHSRDIAALQPVASQPNTAASK